MEFKYVVRERTLRRLCQYEAPRFEGARMIWNIKILAFTDGVEFGSRLLWSYQGPRKLEFGYVVQKWRFLWSNEFRVPSFEEARIKKQH